MFRWFDADDALSNVSETGAANGQLTAYAAKALTHDTKGNVTGFGTDTFAYSSENLMTSATVGGTATTLSYDPLLRLYQSVSGATTSRFAYDGLDALAEYNASNALQRRWVFDPTGVTGQPLVWYEGTGTAATDRRYLSADERGSIISVSDSAGAALAVNRHDEFGNPAAANLGRFGYTARRGCRPPSSGITRRGSIIRGWADSCSPTRSGTGIVPTSTLMCSTIRRISSIRWGWKFAATKT